MHLHVMLEPSEDGGYTVTVPSLPGCISEGDTRDEALANIREAIQLYLEPVEDDLAAVSAPTVRNSWRSRSDESPQSPVRPRHPSAAARRLGRRAAARQSHPLAEAHRREDAQDHRARASADQTLDARAHPQAGAASLSTTSSRSCDHARA